MPPFAVRDTCSIIGHRLTRSLLQRSGIEVGRRGAIEKLLDAQAERATRHVPYDLIDAARMCVAEEGFAEPHELRTLPKDEILIRALSTAAFADVLEETGRAFLMAAFDAEDDTTLGWCSERFGVTFQELPRYGVSGDAIPMRRVTRGGQAERYTLDQLDVDVEAFRAFRFGRDLRVDERELMDDQLAAIQAVVGRAGEAARAVRPDLVYSLLLANPSLATTERPVFHADHRNVVDESLTSSTLGAATKLMREQRIDGRPLGLRPHFLVVAPALEETARQILRERQLSHERDPLELVVEDRIGPAGVRDPVTEIAYEGSDEAWFLTGGGKRAIEVAYVRDTREPRVRNYTLTRGGQWGAGWDVNLDVGAGVVDYRELVRGNV